MTVIIRNTDRTSVKRSHNVPLPTRVQTRRIRSRPDVRRLSRNTRPTHQTDVAYSRRGDEGDTLTDGLGFVLFTP